MYEEYYKNFYNDYEFLSRRYGNYTVFYDFVKMCAISIYNSFSKNQEMEQNYLNTINTYEKSDQQLFPKMFGNLVMMYQTSKELTDILGKIYESEHLGNPRIGQFFTPTHISDFMAKVMIPSIDDIKNIINKQGFISMNEPTCGAGRYDTFFC